MSEVTNWNGCHGNQHINMENVKDMSNTTKSNTAINNTELSKSFDAVLFPNASPRQLLPDRRTL